MIKEFMYFIIDNSNKQDYSRLYFGDIIFLTKKILRGWKLYFSIAKSLGIEKYYISIMGEKGDKRKNRNADD
jgi:hypothetical protein